MARKNIKQKSVMRKNRKYGKHVVVMQNRRISHNYTWLAGVAAIMLMAIICLVVSRSSGRLTDKNAAYDKQIAALTQQIDEQNKRKEELQTRSIYVTTKQFIEELPDDFICPLCKHPASDFEKVVKKKIGRASCRERV